MTQYNSDVMAKFSTRVLDSQLSCINEKCIGSYCKRGILLSRIPKNFSHMTASAQNHGEADELITIQAKNPRKMHENNWVYLILNVY